MGEELEELEQLIKGDKSKLLDDTIQNAESFIKKYYLEDLESFKANKPRVTIQRITYGNNIRLFKINGIVVNKSEKITDRLNNVYSALHSLGLSVVMLLRCADGNVELYMGIKSSEDILEDNTGAEAVFEEVLLGNFPGCILEAIESEAIKEIVNNILPDNGKNAVTSLSTIPSFKGEDETNESYVQGLEKIIDVMQNENFAVLIISDPISQGQLENIKLGYEELYTELFTLAETELTLGKNDAVNVGQADIEGITDTIGKSVSKTQSFTKGTSKTRSESRTNSVGVSLGLMGSEGKSSGVSDTVSASASVGGKLAKLGMGVAHGVMRGVSSAVGVNGGVMASTAKTTGIADTEMDNKQVGTGESREESQAHSTQRSYQEGYSEGSSTSSTVKFENKTIKNILECIDEHLERLKECGSYGMWASAAYFISPIKDTSIIAASAYKGILNGEKTNLEQPSINTWYRDSNTQIINEYLRKFSHPKFYDEDYMINLDALTEATAATMVSTKELAIECNIPYKSVPGIFVREMAGFGRNVYVSESSHGREDNVKIGQIYHMGKCAPNSEVRLNLSRLREHTFITGSTGSGKSNTVYEIISKLNQIGAREEISDRKIPTLIIEPAKGEYKQVFGDDFNVYGTNPYFSEMFKINPFKFEDGIHVLEHIDRLIDIFNVCWPMYAAMPAVLKEAVEQAYILCGWDLEISVNTNETILYPCFSDVLYCLRKVISESDYSQEVKDNYTGSLITRVKSLTTGLNGQIFTANEISTQKLFEESTIIDLSRIGSSETKSMIMGILVMRLQEFRMSKGGINLPLQHVTILEEAHNLLKRTSTEQNSEGSNLIGKSVEMISNAIAEMRTYGEGFVIVDQAPGLLDMSTIRNTNTKIILRLPEYSDRELVGKSAGLSDEQIDELAKIPSGVAAIYQNKWIEPVLCKVDYYDVEPKEYSYDNTKIIGSSEKVLREQIMEYVLSDISHEEPKTDVENLKNRLIASNINSQLKLELIKILKSRKPKDIREVYDTIADCVENLDDIFLKSLKAKNIEEWNQALIDGLAFKNKELSDECKYNILECIIYKKSKEKDPEAQEFNRWMEYMGRDIRYV